LELAVSKDKPVKTPDASPPQPATADRALQHQNMPTQSDPSREQAVQQQQ
jgi:hypothetical protein